MAEKGFSTPLDIKPTISPSDYNWYVTAFTRLHLSRPVSEIACNIPFSEYVAYFQVYEPLESIQDDIEILMEFDRIYVDIHNQKIKQERNLKKNENASKRKR